MEYSPRGVEKIRFSLCLSYVRDWSRVGCAMGNRKADGIDRERRAARSLRKRGYIWWTHFGCKGQFFRRSLGTSDRSGATREAEKLIALAETGKLQPTASSDAEREAQRGASLKKSYADPKLESAANRRSQERWDRMDPESRRQHSEAIKAAHNRPGARKRLSETTKSLWQSSDYRERNTAAVDKAWKSRKLRKQQSERIKAARARPEVKAHHLAGRYRAAERLLRQRGAASDGGPARRPGRPSKEARNKRILELASLRWKHRDIARDVDPEFAANEKAAMDRVRSVLKGDRESRKNTGDSADEPKTLHHG